MSPGLVNQLIRPDSLSQGTLSSFRSWRRPGTRSRPKFEAVEDGKIPGARTVLAGRDLRSVPPGRSLVDGRAWSEILALLCILFQAPNLPRNNRHKWACLYYRQDGFSSFGESWFFCRATPARNDESFYVPGFWILSVPDPGYLPARFPWQHSAPGLVDCKPACRGSSAGPTSARTEHQRAQLERPRLGVGGNIAVRFPLPPSPLPRTPHSPEIHTPTLTTVTVHPPARVTERPPLIEHRPAFPPPANTRRYLNRRPR